MMKTIKAILIAILLFSSSNLLAQSYTQKYNQIQHRYEYYNSNGDMIGYSKWNSIRSQWEYTNVQQAATERRNGYGEYVDPYDTDFMLKALAIKQAQYDKAQASMEAEKSATISRMNQVISYYNSFKVYPQTISDGWHNVYAMDRDNFCDERRVEVYNNRVIKYMVGEEYRIVSFSQPITHGRTDIKLKETGNIALSLFFINYIYYNQ